MKFFFLLNIQVSFVLEKCSRTFFVAYSHFVWLFVYFFLYVQKSCDISFEQRKAEGKSYYFIIHSHMWANQFYLV